MEARALALDIEGERPLGFEEILAAHERRVFLTALRLLGRREDAQDAAQEVFFRLYKHFDRFDRSRDPAPWLYRITVNVCWDIARKRRNHGPLVEMPAPGDSHASLAREEERRLVAQSLQKLPEKERAALVLRDIEGLSTREVARILGSAEVTVRSQVSRARLRIRELLKRHI